MRWEKTSERTPREASRIRCGVLIADIMNIRSRGIPRDIPTLGMELLSIHCKEAEEGLHQISLIFADDRELELTVECINVALTDSGEPWTTDKIPTHDLEN